MSDDLNNQFVQAAKAGDLALLEQLWFEGADIDFKHEGISALSAAAYAGQEACVEFLISKGADVNIRNVVDCTPLMNAADRGYFNIASMLLKAGADPTLRSSERDNKSAEDWARQRDHTRVVALLEGAVKSHASPVVPPQRAKIENDQVTFLKKLDDVKLQEIFNFRSRERISLIRDQADNKVQAMARESFSHIDDQDAIQKAFDVYKQADGKISEAEVFPDRIIKVAAPGLKKGKM